MSIVAASFPAIAQAPAQDVAAGVEAAVFGIMSYTRWPKPSAALRLCVVGRPRFLDTLASRPAHSGGAAIVVSRFPGPDGSLGGQCDAIYTGRTSAADMQAIARLLAGHAVLTITEDDPQCSGINMFCLDVPGSGAQVGFAVNLDSISRSGVSVNPRVLLLGRRKKSAP